MTLSAFFIIFYLIACFHSVFILSSNSKLGNMIQLSPWTGELQIYTDLLYNIIFPVVLGIISLYNFRHESKNTLIFLLPY